MKDYIRSPRRIIGVLSIGILLILIITFFDWNERRLIDKAPEIVEGTVACIYPIYGKTQDMLCYQFQIGGKLYYSRTGTGGLESPFPGQKCLILVDKNNPENEIFNGLVHEPGNLVDPNKFEGEVIWISDCNCSLSKTL